MLLLGPLDPAKFPLLHEARYRPGRIVVSYPASACGDTRGCGGFYLDALRARGAGPLANEKRAIARGQGIVTRRAETRCAARGACA
jgi:hypothetical protein